MSDREAVKRLGDAKNFVSLGYTHSALMAIDDAISMWQAAQAQAGDGEAPVAWLKPAHELVENSAPDVVTAELRGTTIARGGIAASCMENYSVPLYKKQPAVNQQLLEALRLAETSMLDSGYSPQSVTIITVKAAIAAAQEQGGGE